MTKSYGAKVKAVRTAVGVSQTKLAAMIGSTRDIVASWERGRSRVTADGWEKVVAIFCQFKNIPGSSAPAMIDNLLIGGSFSIHAEKSNNTGGTLKQ